jgi:hypothetical protein
MTTTLTDCTEPWCTDHLVADDGVVMHASEDARAPMTAGGPREQMVALVAIERTDDHGRGRAQVRLEIDGASAFTNGAPMTPSEALQLSILLQRAAFGVLAEGGPDWDLAQQWIRDFMARPRIDPYDEHVQGHLESLLAMVELHR